MRAMEILHKNTVLFFYDFPKPPLNYSLDFCKQVWYCLALKGA